MVVRAYNLSTRDQKFNDIRICLLILSISGKCLVAHQRPLELGGWDEIGQIWWQQSYMNATSAQNSQAHIYCVPFRRREPGSWYVAFLHSEHSFTTLLVACVLF